jgi:alkanesulfonate monooxygenase SsuD/methylene tetrahydromethanopterin reductase-like flavin-dependent oxidoreductase (luciferase family)
MQLGVLTFALESSGDPARLAEKAENLGFSSFWVPEHPIVPVHYSSHYADFPEGRMPEPYSHIADPFVVLARASAATHTIRLGDEWPLKGEGENKTGPKYQSHIL